MYFKSGLLDAAILSGPKCVKLFIHAPVTLGHNWFKIVTIAWINADFSIPRE